MLEMDISGSTKYSTIGIALNSANQVLRVRQGYKFRYSNKTVRIDLTSLSEYEILQNLPAKPPVEDEIVELLDSCESLPSMLLLAAEIGLDRRLLYNAYTALVSYAESHSDINPSLPEACLIFPHVLEYLVRHDFHKNSIAHVLEQFNEVATHRLIIRQESNGTYGGSSRLDLPSAEILATNEYTALHNEIESIKGQGDLKRAKELIIDLCADAEAKYGMPHPISLLYLGQILTETGNFREASQILRRMFDMVFETLETKLSADPRLIMMILSSGTNLATALGEIGRTEEALRCVKKAIGYYRDYTIGAHFEGPMLTNMILLELDAVYVSAKLYDMIGIQTVAEMLTRGALMWSWQLFDENPGAARLQLLLAKITADKGDFERAVGHFDNASKYVKIDVFERVRWIFLRSQHGDYQQARIELDEMKRSGDLDNDLALSADAAAIYAEIAEHDGDLRQALEKRVEALRWSDGYLEYASSLLSNNEMLSNTHRHLSHLYNLANLVNKEFSDYKEEISRLYEFIARRKFFASDVQRHTRESTIRQAEFAELWQTLNELRVNVGAARLFDHNALDFDRQLEELLFEIEDIEAALASAAGGLKLPAFCVEDVVSALPDGFCLVEYFYAEQLKPSPTNEQGTPARYFVFVLTCEGIHMVELGDAESIEEAIGTYSRKINVGIKNLDQYSQALVDKIWNPIVKHVTGYDNIVIATDGEIVRVSFATLKHSGSYLFDQTNISYASTGRDLFRYVNARHGENNAPAVFADPDYDHGLPEMPEFGWTRLDGAREEGQEIAEIFGIEPYLDEHSSEANLKSLMSPSVLHLATHAYFQDTKAVSRASLKGLRPNQVRRLALAGGGIVLAGANAILSNTQGAGFGPDDGLLNEMDILNLDLVNTELVVLSACDTGHGKVHMGEGVLGMARCFVLAGAETLIMSLWKVPDVITRTMMVCFYKELLAGSSCTQALRVAQSAIREQYPEVEYWGAFICYGAPGSLSTNVCNSINSKTGGAT